MNSLTLTANSSATLTERFRAVRNATNIICEPLEPEDCVLQSMPDASPIRWHAAHTTWFFETFILKRFVPDYQPVHEEFEFLFNSYYNAVGEPFPRAKRGLLSRPTMRDVAQYRSDVEEHLIRLLSAGELSTEIAAIVEIGLHHEQQHQELMLTDIKHAFFQNPLAPAYDTRLNFETEAASALSWREFGGGIYEIGAEAEAGFCFDNEMPRHEVLLRDFACASRLSTNGDYLAFLQDDGYQRSELWLSEGWATVKAEQATAPLYWLQRDGGWFEFTLAGLKPLDLDRPVCHISYFEADAFARWSNARLLTETEWEVAAENEALAGNFAESGRLHPQAATNGESQMLGDVWEWTQSQYSPYPGYRALPGALGEYNGKFMCNQFVLRGGSCVTPASHIRKSYRNFFPPGARWQFSGIRLAKDAS